MARQIRSLLHRPRLRAVAVTLVLLGLSVPVASASLPGRAQAVETRSSAATSSVVSAPGAPTWMSRVCAYIKVLPPGAAIDPGIAWATPGRSDTSATPTPTSGDCHPIPPLVLITTESGAPQTLGR